MDNEKNINAQSQIDVIEKPRKIMTLEKLELIKNMHENKKTAKEIASSLRIPLVTV